MKFQQAILILVLINIVRCETKCQKDYLYCGDNGPINCVPSDWWCDGHRDCDSGNDESNCTTTICQKNEIQCKSGTQCIPKFLKCDAIAQCLDGSDEENCVFPTKKTCDPLTQFDCNGDGHECIPLSKVCDGHRDCTWNGDELPGGTHDNCQRNDCRLTKNGGCSHICVNRFSSTICHCPDGHRLLDDGKTCSDINECSFHPRRCSQMCNNTVGSYKCSCHDGYELNAKESGQCIAKSGPRSLLVNLEDGQIVTYDLDTNVNLAHNISNQRNSWLNIDINLGTGSNTTVFWSTLKNKDIGQTIIKRKSDSVDQFEVVSQNQIFQLNNGTFCAGLSFDWWRSLLFWTSTEEGRVYVTNTTSNATSVLIDKGLENPRSIVADPFEARLYWIDWGTKPSTARIDTMLMNTQDHRALVKSGLRRPLGIAIDFLDRRLYWSDINPGSIAFIDLNRPLIRKTVISHKLMHPFSLTIFENKVYWSDWRQNQIISVEKTTGLNFNIISKISKPMSIVVLNHLSKPQIDSKTSNIHTCLSTQSNSCSDICLPSPPTTNQRYAIEKCLCPIGTIMSYETYTCFAATDPLFQHKFMPKNVNRYKIIIAVMLSLVVIISVSIIIILLYLCRDRLCTRSFRNMSRHGIKHPIITGDLMYIFKCHSHSSQLSELISSDFNSVSNA